jgi:DNA-binding response OmpR family regulator
MPIRLLIADEFEVVRAGLKSMVAGSGIKVIAEASTGKAAVRLTVKHKPDVAILGVQMLEGDGLNSLGRIKLDRPDQPVLMFSSFDNPTHKARAVALGADGWILKTATHERLLEAIRTAAGGEHRQRQPMGGDPELGRPPAPLGGVPHSQSWSAGMTALGGSPCNPSSKAQATRCTGSPYEIVTVPPVSAGWSVTTRR